MTTHETTSVYAGELLPGDRIEDGGSTGTIVTSIRVARSRRNVNVRIVGGWDYDYPMEQRFDVRLPRQSGLDIVKGTRTTRQQARAADRNA